LHLVGIYMISIFWDVMSCRLIVVLSSSGSSIPGRMDFTLTAWTKVNAIWTLETSANTHQLAKRTIPEGLRIFCNIAVRAANCYVLCYAYFLYVDVSTFPCTLQLITWRRHPATAVLLFMTKRPRYLIWESNNMLGEDGGHCHLGMGQSQDVDWGEDLQIWRVTVTVMNMQSRTANRGWSPRLGDRRGG